MSSRSFSDIKQADWIRACKKLGFVINSGFGKGSHVLVVHEKTGARYTIQYNLHKFINIKIFKKFLELGIEEEEIWQALK